MPFLDLQTRLGVDLDRWLLLQSGEQPNKRAARCHAFEKEWVECSHGIGQTRAKKECQLEFEDFYECMHRQKMLKIYELEAWSSALTCFRRTQRERKAVAFPAGELKRLYTIRTQRDKLIKEGKYTSPPNHTGQGDDTP